nr:immunoglobulin heavy chain junction region [Macaca mulatta]
CVNGAGIVGGLDSW